MADGDDKIGVEIAVGLYGHLAAEHAFTLNNLLAAERDRSVKLANALCKLYGGIAAIPETQRTLYLERLLIEADVMHYEASHQEEWFDVPGQEPTTDAVPA